MRDNAGQYSRDGFCQFDLWYQTHAPHNGLAQLVEQLVLVNHGLI